jgi:hypothetical protein
LCSLENNKKKNDKHDKRTPRHKTSNRTQSFQKAKTNENNMEELELFVHNETKTKTKKNEKKGDEAEEVYQRERERECVDLIFKSS